MRTYGRVGQVNGLGGTWVVVTTDANGYNDQVYITTLIQCLKLNLGESPRFGNYGIPGAPSVATQVLPSYYCAQTQSQFAGYFASLSITQGIFVNGNPVYNVYVLCHSGAMLNFEVAT